MTRKSGFKSGTEQCIFSEEKKVIKKASSLKMEISAERLDEPKKKFWLVLSQLISTSCCCCNCLHCMRGGHDFGNLLMDFPSPKSSSKIPQALTFAMSKFRTKLFYYITEGRSLIGYFNAIFGSLNIEHTALFKSALFCVQSSNLFEVFM